MTRTYRKTTPEERADREAADWSDPWPTAKALAVRHGRDPRTVLIWAQNKGLAPRGMKREPTGLELEAIRVAARAGLPWGEIAAAVGIDRTQALGFFEVALRPLLLAVFALVLLGCPREEVQAPAPTWTPLVCDVPEVLVWDIGGVRTTRRTLVSLLSAPPEDVLVRVLRPERGPCPEDAGCTVVYDTALAPDGRWRYYAPGSDVVTGLEDGTTRVVCSVTIGGTTQVFARDGEYLIR